MSNEIFDAILDRPEPESSDSLLDFVGEVAALTLRVDGLRRRVGALEARLLLVEDFLAGMD